MKRIDRNNIKQWVAGLLLLLFASFYTQVSFFQHTHVINGVTIVHSHVHSQRHHSTTSGEHTIAEITLMAHLAHFEVSNLCFFLYQSSPSYTPTEVSFDTPTQLFHRVAQGALSLRAPPFMCC